MFNVQCRIPNWRWLGSKADTWKAPVILNESVMASFESRVKSSRWQLLPYAFPQQHHYYTLPGLFIYCIDTTRTNSFSVTRYHALTLALFNYLEILRLLLLLQKNDYFVKVQYCTIPYSYQYKIFECWLPIADSESFGSVLLYNCGSWFIRDISRVSAARARGASTNQSLTPLPISFSGVTPGVDCLVYRWRCGRVRTWMHFFTGLSRIWVQGVERSNQSLTSPLDNVFFRRTCNWVLHCNWTT